MREFEVRRCPHCRRIMRVVDGSQRTFRDKTYFMLRCDWCGHEEQDWHERRKSND